MTDLSGDGVRILILATAAHPETALPELPAVAASCHDLREAFINRCGVAERNVVTVFDAPDARTMAHAITAEAARATSVLVVYYIGHGLRGPGGELFLAASDTDAELTPGLAAHQALSFAAVGQALQGCRAPAVVVILDCCFSGTARLDADTASIREFAAGAYGRYLIGSAEYLGLSPAGERHTAFTGALLRLLEHGDPLAPAVLTLDAVFDGIHRLLQDAQGRPLPRRQAGDRAGGLIIAPNSAAPVTSVVRRPPAPGRCPYLGLAPFGPQDAGSFFGRAAMVDSVLSALGTASGRGAVILVGPSGSGKTSLLNAGIIAAVRDHGLYHVVDSAGWPVRRFTPGADPLQRLATALDAPDGRADLDQDPDRVAVDLAASLLANRAGQGLLLIVDQLEELFTLCTDPRTRTAFLSALAALAAGGEECESRVSVLLALRADFYGHAATHPTLVDALRERQVLIEPMTGEELREAIAKPAAAHGWILADGLTEIILSDLGADLAAAALPLLSHALWSTWTRRDDTTLTVTGYRDTGGISHAIKRSAEAIYTSSSDAGRAALRLILPRLVRVGADGHADTAQPAERTGLTHGIPDPATAVEVLDHLTAARLITIDRDTVRLSHEALLREWPRLREWIDTDRDWRHRSQRFITDSRDWRDSRDDALLYRGTRLAAIRDRDIPVDQDPILADSVATDYLATAIRAESRQARRRRILTGTLVCLVVALAAATLTAVRAGERAEHASREAGAQRDIAIAGELAGRSQLLANTDPFGSRLTALAAWTIHPTPEIRHSMLTAAHNPLTNVITDVALEILSPDSRVLATAGADNDVRLWNTVTGRPIGAPLKGHTDPVTSMAFAPDGRTLATGSIDRSVRLWDIRTQQPVGGAPLTHADAVRTVAFAPDNRTLATAGADRTVQLWDTSTWEPSRPPLTGFTGTVDSAAFSSDGRVLVIGIADGTVQLWDMATWQQVVQPITSPYQQPGRFTFSPVGPTLITSDVGNEVRIWDTRTGRPIGGPLSDIWSEAVSPDGEILATGGDDGTVRLWDTRTGEAIGPALTGHTATIWSVSFSPDGGTLASGSADGTVRLWDTRTGEAIGPALTGHTATIWSVSFSPDGGTLATASADGTVRLWNIGTGYAVTLPHSGHTGLFRVTSFDGRILSTAGQDGTVRLWDVALWQPISPSLAEQTSSVTVSANGRILAVAGGDDFRWQLRDTATWQPIRSPFTIPDTPDDFAISPDGSTIATAEHDVRLWDTTTGQMIGVPLVGHTDYVRSLAFSPDGRVLATGSQDATVRLWNTATRQQIGAPLHHDDDIVRFIAFSPDSRTLATAGYGDASLRLWDIATGQPVEAQLPGFSSTPWAVAFSPDGRTLATASGDGSVRIWDLATGQPIGSPMIGHAGAIWFVAFSPDGRTLVSVSPLDTGDGTVRVWNVPYITDTAAFLCDWAGGRFTSNQWARYVPAATESRRLCPEK